MSEFKKEGHHPSEEIDLGIDHDNLDNVNSPVQPFGESIQLTVQQGRKILNELTLQTVEQVGDKLFDLFLDKDKISIFMDIIFLKGIDDPSSSFACAQLIRYLCTLSEGTEEKFGKGILHQCHKKLETNRKNIKIAQDKVNAKEAEIKVLEEKKIWLTLDLEQLRNQILSRRLDNFNFMIKLCKSEMLSPKIVKDLLNLITVQDCEEEGSYGGLFDLITTGHMDLVSEKQVKVSEHRPVEPDANNSEEAAQKIETNVQIEDVGSVDHLTSSLTDTTNGENMKEKKNVRKEYSQVPLSDAHDISTVSIPPTPLDVYCDLSMKSHDGDLSDTSFNNETNELNSAKNRADESQDLSADEEDLEAVEINTSDKEDEENTASDAPKKIRKYDREFLMLIGQSPASKKKRDDIPIADVLKSGGSNHKDQVGYGSRTPLNSQHGRYGPMRPKDGRMGNMGPPLNLGHRGWIGLGQPLPIPPTPPRAPVRVKDLHMNIKLHTAENAWKPSHRDSVRGGGGANSGGDGEMSADEKLTQSIVKQTRGILNKLTPENFQKLCDKFLKLELNDRDDRISAVIDVVFEKGINEPNFSTAYARMVNHVCQNSQETAKKFRKEILDQCQKEFQKTSKDEDEIKSAEAEILSAPEDKKEQLKLELEDKRTQMSRRSLGNVRFIGEFYKLQMLTPKIMVDCVHMLINNQDEESYECLCKLLTTVGQKLDNQLKDLNQRIRQARINKQPLPKFTIDDKFMDNTFATLKRLSSETTKLSSRIRFALLNVVELRENEWKPRRDSNASKIIEEVGRDALRQDKKMKRQIKALPDPMMGPRLSSPMTPQQLQSQQKKMGSDWNTVQCNKSSRFTTMGQAKPSEPNAVGSSPVLAPNMGGWGSQPQNRGGNNRNTLPPRLQQQQQQQQQQQNPMSSSFGGQQSHNNNNGHLPQQMSNRFGPSMGSSQPNRFNILSSQQQPAQPPPSQPLPPPHTSNIPEVLNLEPPTPEVNETVKNIFYEFCSVKKYEDTIHWVNERFPGDKVMIFVDCLARQVGEMSKPELLCGAGQLIKMLIKQKAIRKDLVLRVLSEGLISDIADIQVDCSKVTTYVAVFILEVFGEESNFNWLLELTRPLREDEETMADLIRVTLNQLQLTKNEEYVKSLWKLTDERDSISDDCLPWPKAESITSLVLKFVPVLQKHEKEDILKIYNENKWDMRGTEICAATLIATCEVSFVDGTWAIPVLEKCLALFSSKASSIPNVWKYAKEFIKTKSVNKPDEEVLWSRLMKLNLISNKDRY